MKEATKKQRRERIRAILMATVLLLMSVVTCRSSCRWSRM